MSAKSENFSVVSYNLWFDQMCQIERIQQIICIIFSLRPDVVCLQEVTPRIYSIFDSLLREVYNFSKTEIKNSYETLILSRHKITRSVTFPFRSTKMGRDLHIIEIEREDKTSVTVGTMHLESLFGAQGRQIKLEQLEQCFNIIRSHYSHGFFYLMGDTNLDFEKIDLPSNWIDAWIRAGSPPEHRYTFDVTRNNNIKGRYRSRLDRVLIRKNGLDQVSIDSFFLIGTEPISGSNIFPSDHFGIYCLTQIY